MLLSKSPKGASRRPTELLNGPLASSVSAITLSFTLALAGCTNPKPSVDSPSETGSPETATDTSEPLEIEVEPENLRTPCENPETVTRHIGFHMFTTGWDENTRIGRLNALSGDMATHIPNFPADATCASVGSEVVELRISTEFSIAQCSHMADLETCKENLRETLETIHGHGFNVELLLAGHYVPAEGFMDFDQWTSEHEAAADGGAFMPYLPASPAWTYVSAWEIEMMEVVNEMPDIVSAVWVINEPGFGGGFALESNSEAQTLQKEMVSLTLSMTEAVQGTGYPGPIGPKLAIYDLVRPSSGWTTLGTYDPAAALIQSLSLQGATLGVDFYPEEDSYDEGGSMETFLTLLSAQNEAGYPLAQMSTSEFANKCEGDVDELTEEEYTTSSTLENLQEASPELAASLTLFAINPTGPWSGCYATHVETEKEGVPGLTLTPAGEAYFAALNAGLESL